MLDYVGHMYMNSLLQIGMGRKKINLQCCEMDGRKKIDGVTVRKKKCREGKFK